MSEPRKYVYPDSLYIQLAKALCTPEDRSFARVILDKRPAGAWMVDVEVRYRDRNGKQVGDVLGFELLTPAAESLASTLWKGSK